MKLAICAIAKHENNYIEEWVNHHIDVIGVDHIFLYDNNDIDYEPIQRRIVKNKDKLTIIPWAGSGSIQWSAYKNCYINHKDEYDWIAFIDVDEFIIMK